MRKTLLLCVPLFLLAGCAQQRIKKNKDNTGRLQPFARKNLSRQHRGTEISKTDGDGCTTKSLSRSAGVTINSKYAKHLT